MGSKCAVLNLGQSGRSIFFSLSLSVVQCCSGIKPTHDSASLFTAGGQRFFHLSVSHICLSESRVVSAICRCHFVHAVATTSLLLTYFLVTSCSVRVHKVPIAYTVHQIAQHCMSLWTHRLPVPLFFFTQMHSFIFSLAHRSLFTVCFAFEQGVRLSIGREEGTHVLVSLQRGLLDVVLCPSYIWLNQARQESED